MWPAAEIAKSHGPGRRWRRSMLDSAPDGETARRDDVASTGSGKSAPRPPPCMGAGASQNMDPPCQQSMASQFWDEGMFVHGELLVREIEGEWKRSCCNAASPSPPSHYSPSICLPAPSRWAATPTRTSTLLASVPWGLKPSTGRATRVQPSLSQSNGLWLRSFGGAQIRGQQA